MSKKLITPFVPEPEDVIEFLEQSNAIEGEYSGEARFDAKKAWDYIMTLDQIFAGGVLEVHRLLLERLDPEIAGSYRTDTVWIGGMMKPFVSYTLINDGVKSTCDVMNSSMADLAQGVIDENIAARVAKTLHVQFEDIHPFFDGNGRTGRILYNWHRIKMGLPLHIIHEGKEQMEYYKWFKPAPKSKHE